MKLKNEVVQNYLFSSKSPWMTIRKESSWADDGVKDLAKFSVPDVPYGLSKNNNYVL